MVWWRGGVVELRLAVRALENVQFVGEVSPRELGNAFRSACLFVMPSRSEGVPKVTKEAAACGLPIVLFGYYEAPSVEHMMNGLVVWSDEEFYAAVDQMLQNAELRSTMGVVSAGMQEARDWDLQARQWVEFLLTKLQ